MFRRLVVVSVGLLVAGVVTAAPAFAAAPTITSFTPTSGPQYTAVTITGTNFTSPATVKFNGVATNPVTVVSATTIKTRVPLTSSTGRISVTTAGGTATSSTSFTVTPGTYAYPTSGPPTSRVSVFVSGFAAGEAVDVYFDSTEISLAVSDSTGDVIVKTTIPDTATAGTHWFTAVGRRSGSAAQGTYTVRTDWAQPDFDAGNTTSNPFENQLTPTTVGKLARRWTVTTGSSSTTTPAIVGGVVYHSYGDGSVRAYDAASGVQKWNVQIAVTGNFQLSSPALANGLLYVGVQTGKVIALSASTGAQVWSVDLGSAPVGSPTVSGTRLYVGTSTGAVYALDAASGAQVWSTQTSAPALGPALAVADGNVYAVGMQENTGISRIFALVASSGAQRWSVFYTGPILDVVAVGGAVYFDGVTELIGRSAAGSNLGRADLSGATSTSMAYADGKLYVTGDSELQAVDVTDFATDWAVATTTDGSQRVAVAGGVVYTGNSFRTFLYDAATGRRIVGLRAGVKPGGVAVSDGAVFTADTSTGALVRFDVRDATTPDRTSRPTRDELSRPQPVRTR